VGLTLINKWIWSGATSKAKISQPFSIASSAKICLALVAISPTKTFFRRLGIQTKW
jgi:hypothetical protein